MHRRGDKVALSVKEIKRLYCVEGLGATTIARQFDCSENTIYRFMKKHSITILPQHEAASRSHLIIQNAIVMKRPTTFTTEIESEICKDYKEYGINSSTLAKKYNCTRAIILKLLKRNGIPKKSKKEILGDQFKGENNPNFGNGKGMEKENNVRWIHDRTKLKACLRESMRKSLEYATWRKSVFARDEYKCVVCQSQGYLEAHHIIKLSVLLKDNGITNYDDAIACQPLWEVGNGVTLCRSCHDKTKHKESEYAEIFKEVINQ